MRILLVDDDAGVVQALLAVLKTLPGHEIRTAGMGGEALGAAMQMGGVDLLITDVVMEPMDGFTLRDRLVAKYPDMRTILISGYDLSDYPEQTQHHQVLAKPIDGETLCAAVAKEIPAAPEPEPASVPEPVPVAEVTPEPAPVAAQVPESEPEPEPAPVSEVVPEPESVAEPVATPVPVAAPVATPAAVPVPARPVAVPVARPGAVPVAKAAPSPAAVPVPTATPRAVPNPTAAPVPTATPKAVPNPAAAPVPTATPRAVPNPTAAPVPTATPRAVPNPTAAPVPTATPRAVPNPAAGPVPTATPRAVPNPTAAPMPTATPRAVPNPAAAPVPTAIPAARPTAVPAPSSPQAVPTARPAAAGPVAVPKAAPVGQPAVPVKAPAVPQPSPVAPPSGAPPSPPAVPVNATVKAQPSASAIPPVVARPPSVAATGNPVPVARPGATPGPQPRAAAVAAPGAGTAQPKAVSPAAGPRPVAAPSTVVIPPVASPAAASAPPAVSEPAAAGSGEDLSGQMLGAYQIQRKLSEGRWGGIYAGLQTSINRPVSIEVLDAAKAADPTSQARFVADARAKAAVQHPSILAVYEAGEADGRFFYAYEYVDGQTIAELKAAGQRLDEPTALKVLRVAADGLSYFNVHHTPHTPPDAGSISLGVDGHPRLANLATQLADETLAPPEEIQALGRVMLGVLPAIQTLSPGLRDMLKRMVQPGPQSLTSWGHLLQGIKGLEPKIVPTDAAKISAQDRAAIAAVELARKQQKKSLYYNLASVATLLILVGVTIWYFMVRNKQRIYDEQVQIPAGSFLFANGEKKDLPDFWIDKYEVTYGQYADFVKALEDHPTTEFDHKEQPRSKNSAMHKPPHWEIYYGRAKVGTPVRSIPIDLSCPVGEVDFWDAYAYAKWKGRELPTEEEWEKAARGTNGFIYPWGEDLDPKKVNSNADYNPNDPAAKGQIDGYNFWNPVDKIKGDKSPFGVVGMAGNVREWTNTWDKGKRHPIVKGGSFMSSDVRLDQRTDVDPNYVAEAVGFRTISRTPPVKK